MNKYLKGFLNSIIRLVIIFVGGLFSINILWAGYLFFPDIIIRTDQVLMGYQIFSSAGVFAGILGGVMYFIIGCLPLCFLVAMLAATVLSFFFTIWLMNKTDIEKIGASFIGSSKAKPKED